MLSETMTQPTTSDTASSAPSPEDDGYFIEDSRDKRLMTALARQPEAPADAATVPQKTKAEIVSRQTARRVILQELNADLAETALNRRERRRLVFGRDRAFPISDMARELIKRQETN